MDGKQDNGCRAGDLLARRRQDRNGEREGADRVPPGRRRNKGDLSKAIRQRLVSSPRPVLIDEWQRVPCVAGTWFGVPLSRRCGSPGQFLLTGSASPASRNDAHRGRRIVSLRMRPMTLMERGVASPSVSLAALLRGDARQIAGTTGVALEQYALQMLASGLPELLDCLRGRPVPQLDGYLARVIDDLADADLPVSTPACDAGWRRTPRLSPDHFDGQDPGGCERRSV